MDKGEQSVEELKKRIEALEKENAQLRARTIRLASDAPTVSGPPEFKPIFDVAQDAVGSYFDKIKFKPENGTIEIADQRYVLVRAAGLSYDFFNAIKALYADRGEDEAFKIGQNFLFDIAHVIGLEDAKNFHKKMNLVDPIERLSAGPVHFAYSGWAFVDIQPESSPTPDENFILKYNHPYSFEADTWVQAGKKSEHPVCIMNAGYSSGWCQESFGVHLTAVEICCKAKGDDNCTFIMAPPHKIKEHIKDYMDQSNEMNEHDVPLFFSRKESEEKIKRSLVEKEVLLKEIHHRVKNNLQIISSLLNLQSGQVTTENVEELYLSSRTRIKTMALVHEKLYSSANLSAIDLKEYASGVVELLRESYENSTDAPVETKIEFEETILLNVDHAIVLGLILNEIISNSFKYAFDDHDDPRIEMTFKRVDNILKLDVSDNGSGIDESIAFPHEGSLGLELIESLVGQLDGTIELVRGNGTRYLIEVGIG